MQEPVGRMQFVVFGKDWWIKLNQPLVAHRAKGSQIKKKIKFIRIAVTHLNHLSLYISQVAWFLPVSFVNVQIYFLVLLLVLNTIESDGFLWRASRRLKTLFLVHSCFRTRHSSFLEPKCLPNTRILLCKRTEFV